MSHPLDLRTISQCKNMCKYGSRKETTAHDMNSKQNDTEVMCSVFHSVKA